MAKINLYVTEDLKRRMDKVKDANWSAVAAAAFEKRLGEIAEQKAQKTMADVIARLRGSKLTSASEIERWGHQDGRRWAMEKASYDELRRLAEYNEQVLPLEEGVLHDGNPEGPGFTFCQIIRPQECVPGPKHEDVCLEASDKFWRSVQTPNSNYSRFDDSEEYVTAFARSSLEVWREVKDKV